MPIWILDETGESGVYECDCHLKYFHFDFGDLPLHTEHDSDGCAFVICPKCKSPHRAPEFDWEFDNNDL